MITANAVVEPLYYFSQMAFHDKTERMKEISFSHGVATRVIERLKQAGALSIKEVLEMPEPEMRVIYELMTQYIMFLTMFQDLPFPPDFLCGTNEVQLGRPLLEFLVERKFPFPQTLPQ